ncbi:hypothetical protein ACPXAU_24485, partial [Salmonella enterica]
GSSIRDVERPVIHGVEVSVPSIGGHGLWPEPCNPGQGPKHGGNSATLCSSPVTLCGLRKSAPPWVFPKRSCPPGRWR